MSERSENPVFYEHSIKATRRNLYSVERLSDRWTQPTVVVSGLLLVATVVFALPGFFSILDRIVSLTCQFLWESFVHIFPLPLLRLLDPGSGKAGQDAPMTGLADSHHAEKSQAMRRVLGLSRSDGMMQTVLRARSRALSATGSAFGFKTENSRPAGLGNMDNSCYQNSILQSLASLQPLPEYLSNCVSLSEEGTQESAVAQTLRTLVSDLADSSNNGKTLWTPKVLKSMSSIQQQDASEYFSKVLDDIDKGVANVMKSRNSVPASDTEYEKDNSTITLHNDSDSGYDSQSATSAVSESKKFRNPLEGLTAQRVSCTQCGFTEGFSLTTFNCLMLSLDDATHYDIYERLDAFTDLEHLEGVHCPKCTLLRAQKLLVKLVDMLEDREAPSEQLEEPKKWLAAIELALEEDDFDDETLLKKCKIGPQSRVSTSKSKQIAIARPPQSLAIHINRSVFNKMTFDLYKNSAPVTFPAMLDLGPWCLGSARDLTDDWEQERPAEVLREEDDLEQWLTHPTKSMVSGSSGTSKLTGPIYELRAAVTHYGRHDNGHYICYRKHKRAVPYWSKDSKDVPSSPGDAAGDGVEDTPAPLSEVNSPAGDSESANGTPTDWWRLSDHNVTRVEEQEVLRMSPGIFMLFYDCVDPEMILETQQATTDGTSEVPEDQHPQYAQARQASRPEEPGVSAELQDTAKAATPETAIGTTSDDASTEFVEAVCSADEEKEGFPPVASDADEGVSFSNEHNVTKENIAAEGPARAKGKKKGKKTKGSRKQRN